MRHGYAYHVHLYRWRGNWVRCWALRNYPRFPSNGDALTARADLIAKLLLEKTFQHSYLLVTPEVTKWFSLRDSQSAKEVERKSEPEHQARMAWARDIVKNVKV